MRLTRTWLGLPGLIILIATTRTQAVEIKGTVLSVSGGTAAVAIQGDEAPNIGDKAEIFFNLAGTDASVASASVTKVEADAVQLKIENATGEVAKDQLVRIASSNPQKRPTSSTPSVSPATSLASSTTQAYVNAFKEGLARQTEGKYEDAIAAYTKAIEIYSGEAGAFYDRGLCYDSKGNYRAALEDMSRALALDGKFIHAYEERARDRLYLEDWSPALLDDCNHVLIAEPENAWVYVFRGAYYLVVGARDAAEADFKKAVSLKPELATQIQAFKQARAKLQEKKPRRRKR